MNATGSVLQMWESELGKAEPSRQSALDLVACVWI